MNINTPSRSPALATLLSLAAGIAGDHFLVSFFPASASNFLVWIFVLVGLIFLFVSQVAWRVLGRRQAGRSLRPLPSRSGILVLLLVGVAGGMWHHGFWNYYPENSLAFSLSHRPQAVMLRMLVCGPIQYSSADGPFDTEEAEQKLRVRFLAEVQQVRRGTKWISQTGRCRVTILGRPSQPLQRGDMVVAYAMAQRVTPAQNPGQNDFALYERLHRRLFSLTIFSPDHARVDAAQSRWHYARVVDQWRDYFSSALERYVGVPHHSLAQALLLGQREQITKAHRDRYVQAGVIHLLAISGLHVGILASGIWLLQRMGWLPRRVGLLVLAVLIIAYTLLTGSKPPVVRAAVLVLSLCIGQHDGRVTRGIDSLALGGILLLIWNPCHLFMLGVQLSFMAVATLMILARTAVEPLEPLQSLIANSRPWFVKAWRTATSSVAELLWLGTTVWLVTTPLVVANFQIASPVALILNPLLSIPIAVVLFSSLLTLLFAPAVPLLSSFFGWLSSVALHCVESLIDVGLAVPGGRLHCASPSPWWIIGHLILVYLLLTLSTRSRQRWCAVVMAIWIAAGLALSHHRNASPEELTCTFLSVGHGTCVVVELPNGDICVYDAGCLGAADYAGKMITAALRQKRIHSIDMLVLSHADADHYNAAPYLLREFPIKKVVVSSSMFARPAPPLRELAQTIKAAGAEQHHIASGGQLADSNDFELNVLHPPPDRTFHSDNANSIVLSIQFQGIRILLPGDLEADGMQHLLSTAGQSHQIALAPHHGSLRSRPAEFSSWCNPETVIISGRDGETLDESIAEYRRLAAHPLSTTKGAIQVTIRAKAVEVKQWRDGNWQDLN